MKTKLEMAHDYVMKIIEGNVRAVDASDLLDCAWQYADAMQAEADKRTTKCDEKIEINMYPEWDASINYPPDAWVMYRGEKRLAVSIKDEWQPDWSQAPDWAVVWVAGCNEYGEIRNGIWFDRDVKPNLSIDFPCEWRSIDGNELKFDFSEPFGYQGKWQGSLRKRPQ